MKSSNRVLDLSKFIFPVNVYDIFKNKNKTALEIGFGEGEFLINLASENRDWNFLGIEIKVGRFKKAVRSSENLSLSNIKLIHIEAEVALKQIFDKSILDTVYINFPDPWPKKKHKKNRLFNHDFIKNLSKVLTYGGKVKIKTDHREYFEQITCEFNKSNLFRNVYGGKNYIIDKEEKAKTKFESEFKEMGTEIFVTAFTNLQG